MDNISSDVRYSVLREKSSEWQPDNEIELNMEAVYSNTTSSPTAVMQQSSSSSSSSANSRRCLPNLTEMEPITHDEQVELAVTSSAAPRGSNTGIDPTNRHGNSPRVSLANTKLANYSADTSQIPGIQYLNAANLTEKLKKRRTLLEKIQFAIIILLVVLLFALFVTLVSLRQKIQEEQLRQASSSSSNQTDYCNSYRCILVSGSMYKSINKKINPCDDFYEYACGGWIKKNLIPTGFPRWGTLNLITYENQLLIKDQLELNRSVPEITEAEDKARTFYKSCLDREGVIEKLRATPLMNILNKIIYKAPNNNSLVINESFSNLLSLIQITYGLNSLFEFNVLDDDKNSSYSNIEIIQGSLGLDRSFYINNQSEKNAKAMEIYKKTIVNVINLLFDKVENANEEMENLIKFETDLAYIMLPNEKLSEVESIYSRVKIGDLSKKHASFFDWKIFFNNFLKTYGSNEVLNDNDEIIIMGLDYFTKLNDLIREYQAKGQEKTVKLSVIFHLIKFSLPLLSKEYRAELTTLGEALTGSITVERWQTCIEHTDNIFGLGYAITRMFIRASPNNAKIEAQKMIRSIKHSFIENFPKIAWMDEETRHLAEEKVNSVDDLIGYPDFIENDDQLNGRYKDLAIKEDDYFGNEIRLVQYALKSEILTYRTRVNRAEWEMTSSAVNAYYSPTRNQIVFPSGILQDPFFHPENPMSINYGSIGTIMGHELTHGFDDSGREYDKSGMMKQWWNNETIENFKNASKCMIQQYSQYKIEDESLNGKQTLGENIADNGGLRAAFYAYEKWVKEHGEEKQLPLLGLTHRQLFFVSFAQTWCSKSTADSLHLSLSVDQHSPPRFRVIGTISNSNEFAKAFKCPANSRMNPLDKCKIW